MRKGVATDRALSEPGARDGRHRLDRTRNEGCLTLGHGVVDGHARAFVEDLDTEDLRRAHRAVLVGAGQGDIEGQDLVGVERGGKHLVLADSFLDLVVELVDGRGDIRTERTGQRAGEHSATIRDIRVLGTDLVGIGNERALRLLEEVQEGMTIEVDPDELCVWPETLVSRYSGSL